MDNWKHRSRGMRCKTCMYYVGKIKQVKEGQMVEISKEADDILPIEESSGIGRCRRNAPTMKGWPVMFQTDWCGEHKLDEEKI